VHQMLRDALDLCTDGPAAIRFPKTMPPDANDTELATAGSGLSARRLRAGQDVCIIGVGKMLASPSPFLGVAIGQGIAEAAPTALAANFKQQGLDISMMDRLGKQIGVLASDIAVRGGPGMDPTLD